MLPEENRPSWLDRPLFAGFTLNLETILFTLILVLAVVSRFYHDGARVMSHDETSHVYFSWRLYHGDGYQHDPITHGPLQFHLIALSYFLLGDNDFSARVPAALFSVATIAFAWNYRRYLGRAGTLVAALMLLISPYILYYGRYARNEAFIGLFGLLLLWAMLRYLETGAQRYMLWVTAATVLHFISKETAFIYTAQALIFLALFFLFRVIQTSWPRAEYRNRFLVALVVAILLVAAGLGTMILSKEAAAPNAAETAQPSVPGQATTPVSPPTAISPGLILIAVALLVFVVAAYFLVQGYSLTLLRKERSFDLLILLGTLVLPMLAPFPDRAMGWNSLDYSYTGMLRTASFLIPLAAIGIAVGLWWNPRVWLINAALFYAVFTVFYTTLFTNGAGFFTGMVGSLGYWLEQQGVERGNQPWYYYLAVQIPVYEYLPAIGSLLALALAFVKRPFAERLQVSPSLASEIQSDGIDQPGHEAAGLAGLEPAQSERGSLELKTEEEAPEPVDPSPLSSQRLAITLLGFWAITSLLAYTYAGEKMPWLTFHITWPMILLSGWSIGSLIDAVDWRDFWSRRGYLVLALLPVFLIALLSALGALLGTNPPFQGKELAQLQATMTFITALLFAIASGIGIYSLVKSWQPGLSFRIYSLFAFAFLALLTARTALTASFINYNDANELLVYAHSGPGNKTALAQIEEISRRTTNGLALTIAYDNETTYPFWWYLRNYPNQRYYAANPTRDLRDDPIILVGDKNYGKIEPIVGQAYNRFDYIRMWWPNQDYYNLTWDRIWNAIRDPQMREAVFQIWLNRDYTLYGKLTNQSGQTDLATWSPAAWMRLYIRKDVASKLWNYGVGPSQEVVVADPYEGKEIKVNADIIIGQSGTAPGQFNRPRDLAVAPDGSIYVADTNNHRIQHLGRDGTVIQTWGSFADVSKGPAPGGTFNEPWGIALSPDGSAVYVADTWNHRIQKFDANGKFITMWGLAGQAESPEAFWGPRDVDVDKDGNVLVADTGNKRIVVFDANGKFLTQFGSSGFQPGEFNEPIGLANDDQNQLFVADTWNQRIQVFNRDAALNYTPLKSWDIYGWSSQSLDNKPYLAVDSAGHLFATDPEGNRVLEFNTDGTFLRFWGDYSTGADGFNLAGSVAADPTGGVWVSDVGNGRVMHFTLP